MRVLVLSAEVGESHAAMARALARDLERRHPGATVTVVNDFSVLGPRLGRLLSRGFRYHLGTVQWSYDLAYLFFTRVGPARRAGELALYALGGSALAATVAGHAPDVVVSTYPVLNPVLARLRAAGRLQCPVVAVVGPLAGLGFWVQPGIDLHVLNYAEALPAVRRRAGSARARPVRPLVREEFFAPVPRAAARSALGIAADRGVVIVSGGGWGAGDLSGAIDACVAVPGVHVIAVAGRNALLRRTLAARFGDGDAVTVLGFTDRMRELLCAANVLVTATAGLSCLEARLCGCPTVCYGFPVGHVRDNTRALQRHGLARIATTPAELSRQVENLLAEARPQSCPALGPLPSAAELVLGLGPGGAAAGDGGLPSPASPTGALTAEPGPP